MSVDADTQSYTLFDHDGVEVCILVLGSDTTSADLDRSWFSNYKSTDTDEENFLDAREPEGQYR